MWTLNFPTGFTFDYYGQNYDSVFVSSNGFVQFEVTSGFNGSQDNSVEQLKQYPRIAPLWDDISTVADPNDDIFVDTSQTDRITIRWNATHVSSGSDVNVAVTLLDDGGVEFHYGPGNTGLTPTIGLSMGDHQTYKLSTNDAEFDLGDVVSQQWTVSPGIVDIGAYEFLGNALDVTAPQVLSTTPLEIDSEGTIVGLPTQISVQFSEPIDHVDATALANYELRDDGGNGIFDDTGDVIYESPRIDHELGSSLVTITMVDGGLLPGNYRLTLSGSNAVRDLSGLKLDGDANGIEGGDYVREFTVHSAGSLISQFTALANSTITTGESTAANPKATIRSRSAGNTTMANLIPAERRPIETDTVFANWSRPTHGRDVALESAIERTAALLDDDLDLDLTDWSF